MTGLYAQQAAMGDMVADYGRYPYSGYLGDLSAQTITIPEALRLQHSYGGQMAPDPRGARRGQA